MKPLSPKRVSWAGLLASGFTILSGFVSSLFVIMAFSDSQNRDLALVVIVFTVIMLVPVMAFRTPPEPAEKKPRRPWMSWFRRRRTKGVMQRYWRRKLGQQHHQPFGHRQLSRPSTFVAAPRKPTEP